MRPLSLKNAQRPFTAARDEHGIPHARVPDWSTAVYALGYLHAIDRGTQLLFARAIASGRAAELLADKPELLETDRFFRRVGLHLNLEAEVAGLKPAAREWLNDYCAGINDGLAATGRTLPMWATGFRPEPWRPESVLLIGNLLSFGGLVISQQENERILLNLIQEGVDEAKLRELFGEHLANTDFVLLKRVQTSSRLSDKAFELISDLPRLAGSNAWAVAPARSASGHALLAGDPHLEINRLPAIWYEAVLAWGDQYVMGASLPGAPLFAVARTNRLAWGVTYFKADTSDFFIEDCRQGGATEWQYRRGEQWHDFAPREETILRKSGSVETLRVLSSPQGTLERLPVEAGLQLASAWVGNQRAGAGGAIATWLDLVGAADVASAMQTVKDCPQPTLRWVFADRAGHIGAQVGGWIPQRQSGHNGMLPAPAWDAKNHWVGILSPESLPSTFDPPAGFVSAANEPLAATDGTVVCTQPLPDYRRQRIAERLRELSTATVEDMQALQYDVVSTQARQLLAIFLPHLPDGELRLRLSNWNCNYSPESHEATLFQHLYRHVLLEVFGHEAEGDGQGIGWRRMLYLCSRAGYSTPVLTSIDRLLAREGSLWWAGRDKGELIRRAAQRAEQEKIVPWGQFNSFRFSNRFFSLSRVGRALGFHTGELPMPGCHATPFQGHLLTTANRETTFAPSYHFVTDLGTDEAWSNLPGGASESRFSPFYKNDIPRWRTGQYRRLKLEV